MQFGLHGAPATIHVCGPAAAYIDDIVVFSETWEEHAKHLAYVLQRIQAAGLVINPKNGHIDKTEVEYLGLGLGLFALKRVKLKALLPARCLKPRIS